MGNLTRAAYGVVRSVTTDEVSRVRTLVVPVAVSTVLALAVTACGTLSPDGPIVPICGTNIGRASFTSGDGPFYIDATRQQRVSPVQAAAQSAPINVRVSGTCSEGAKVTVSDPHVIAVQDEIQAKNGAVEVILVSPISPGHATLTATKPGAPTITVIFAVGPAIASSESTLNRP